MRIEILNNKTDLFKIESEWKILFDSLDLSVFQSYDYCFNSVNESDDLFVIILWEEDNIKEIWPLIRKKNNIEFICHIHADFCDVLSLLPESVTVIDFLRSSLDLNLLSFNNVRSDSTIYEKVKNLDNLSVFNEVSFTELKLKKSSRFPDNFTHFIYRKRRRLSRILKKYNGELIIYENKYKKFPKQEIILLRDNMIKDGVRDNNFLNVNLLILIEKLFLSSLLKISILIVKDKVSGISVYFHQKNQYSFWIDLYDNKQMINIYHNTLFMKKTSQKEDSIFNFGRGDYNYKILNFSPSIYPLYNIVLFRSKASLLFYNINYTLFSLFKYIFKKLSK